MLTYVETGNVDAGIVYKTDALISDKVKIGETAAATSHEPIHYPLGVIKESKHKKEATSFYEYLQSKDAQSIFKNMDLQSCRNYYEHWCYFIACLSIFKSSCMRHYSRYNFRDNCRASTSSLLANDIKYY